MSDVEKCVFLVDGITILTLGGPKCLGVTFVSSVVSIGNLSYTTCRIVCEA